MIEKSKILTPLAIVIAGLLIAGSIFYINKTKVPQENVLSPQEAAERAINYINQNKDEIAGGNTASLVGVSDAGQIYKIRLKIGENEFDSYVTKDGKYLFPGGYDLTVKLGEETLSAQEPSKSDKPDVKLFVMSYCPFGLQMQKAFLPVYNLLKDKAEMGVYFVNYIMHEKKEIDENLRQYCIQKEEKEKYYNYLNCFVKDGNFEKCLSEANVDRTKLSTCISTTDEEYNVTAQYNDKNTWLNGQFPKFDVHTDLNEKYGVRGSPTVVINDTVVEINPRSPEKFKEVICQAFNSPPPECSQTLSDQVFSPGFGLEAGSGDGGQCE